MHHHEKISQAGFKIGQLHDPRRVTETEVNGWQKGRDDLNAYVMIIQQVAAVSILTITTVAFTWLLSAMASATLEY